MSTHNICFRGEIRKILCGYPSCLEQRLLQKAGGPIKISNNVQTDINSDIIEDYIILSSVYDSDARNSSKLDPKYLVFIQPQTLVSK